MVCFFSQAQFLGKELSSSFEEVASENCRCTPTRTSRPGCATEAKRTEMHYMLVRSMIVVHDTLVRSMIVMHVTLVRSTIVMLEVLRALAYQYIGCW